MTLKQAMIEAYNHGATEGRIRTIVFRTAVGDYGWLPVDGQHLLSSDSTSETVWLHDFIQPIDLGNPTEQEWDEWFEVNKPEPVRS